MSNKTNSKQTTLTTLTGAPIANQQAMTAGPRGPVLMQDVQLLEQMQHFNRERIPERVVHAKGSGAYGTFTVTNDVSKYTKANFLSAVGKKTEVFLRFSTVAGEKGAADAERDVRGFAVKFYTEEGNFDLVGNNTPVFFIRDPYKFKNFIHTQKRHPQTNLRDANMQWDFWSLCPEALHQITILFSDRGIPASYRHLHGFGSHTYSLINKDGERIWCKFHFKSQQGIKNMTDEESAAAIGNDRETHQRDLFEAIQNKDFPKWKVKIQVMSQKQAETFRWNPFDLTKVWPHAEFPFLIEIGELELNRNPENYFAEVEQAAFKPSAFVPGVGPSPDKVLQARLMSYADTHLHRLGTNHHQIPVNKPKCPFMNYSRDGALTTGCYGAATNYWPNSDTLAPQPNESFSDPAWDLGSTIVDRFDSTKDHDDYTQAGNLYRLLDSAERDRLASRIAGGLGQARKDIQERMICHFFRADAEYGTKIATKLGITLPKLG